MKAIVIGGGFGGMAAALRLRKRGYEVTLLEKGNQLGGRARVFKRNGYTFDAGPTVITAPFLFDELWQLFGKRREDYVTFVPLNPWYRIQFADGSTMRNDFINPVLNPKISPETFSPKLESDFKIVEPLKPPQR